MIGVSNPAFSVMPFQEAFEDISQHFKLWEILSDADHTLPSIRNEVKIATETTDMKFQVHAPFSDINIAALDAGTRNHAIKTTIETIEIADELEMNVVTLHPGYIMAMGYYDKPRVPKLTRQSLEIIDKAAKDFLIPVALENMPSQKYSLCLTASEMSEMLDSLDLRICFDVGHASLNGQMSEFLELKDNFVNVHLHDNLGDKDKHMALGEGNVGFRDVLENLRDYEGNYIIESRTLDDAIAGKEYLRKLESAHGLSL